MNLTNKLIYDCLIDDDMFKRLVHTYNESSIIEQDDSAETEFFEEYLVQKHVTLTKHEISRIDFFTRMCKELKLGLLSFVSLGTMNDKQQAKFLKLDQETSKTTAGGIFVKQDYLSEDLAYQLFLSMSNYSIPEPAEISQSDMVQYLTEQIAYLTSMNDRTRHANDRQIAMYKKMLEFIESHNSLSDQFDEENADRG